MIYLITGLIVFISIHLLPTFTALRKKFIDSMGYWPYLALFSGISLVGIILIIYGYGRAEEIIIWQTSPLSRLLALGLMLPAFVLVISAYLKTHIRAKLKHPMLTGTALWAATHLFANGDVASILLFGGFLGYSVADMVLAKTRDNLIPKGDPSLIHDLMSITGGILLYIASLYGHGILFGVSVPGLILVPPDFMIFN